MCRPSIHTESVLPALCGVLRKRDDFVEGRNIVDREFREDFAVERDIGVLEAVNHAAVAERRLREANARIDARNPQRAKLAAALATVTIGIPEALHHRFLSVAEELAARQELAFGQFEDFLVAASGDEPTLATGHRFLLLLELSSVGSTCSA